MIVDVIKRFPLLVILLLVIILIMIFSIIYYHVSKKYEKTQLELKEALLEATTLNQCIHALTNHLDNDDDAINDLLSLILDFFKGDRAYIFQIDYENNTTSNSYEYVKEGITPEIEHLQNVPLESVRYWIDRFKKDGTFYLKSLEEEVNHNSVTYQVLKPQNISSLIAVPLMKNNEITGFLGVDNPRRRYENLSLLSSVVFFIGDSMRRKEQEEKLKAMSYIDALTHIFNRNALIERFEQIKKENELNVGIAYFDLNGLKKINDLQGHLAGDVVLKKTAQLIDEYFPGKTFRFGGDEYVVLYTNIAKADFIKRVNEAKMHLQNHQISCSVGVSWCYQIDDVDTLIKEADTKMYKNKEEFYKKQRITS